MTIERKVSRRKFLAMSGAAAAAVSAPAILRAQTATLKTTAWGGKWGEVMKGQVIPLFEKEFKCKVETDSAFPYYPKLQATPKNAPLYDVLHTNTSEQWQAVVAGLVEPKLDAKKIPNLANVYPYAVSDKICGVSAFTSAIGFGYRTDKGIAAPKSWKDLANPKFAGVRGSYIIPTNSLGQMHLMMLGKVYGKGLTDLNAAYKALEQVWNVTPGSKVKELAHAYIDFILRPDIQKTLAEAVWYSPSNRKVKLDPKYDAKLYNTEAKVAQLIQVDWKWYNERKDEIDARVARILRG